MMTESSFVAAVHVQIVYISYSKNWFKCSFEHNKCQKLSTANVVMFVAKFSKAHLGNVTKP